VEYPVELVPNIAVELSPYQAFLRRQHIMIPGVTGAGGVEKPDRPFYSDKLVHIF
jgi:hypothetical protein